MFKKSTVVFSILALLTFGACTSWAYTVSQWPAPGIPNTVYGPGSANLGSAGHGAAMPGNMGYGGQGGYGVYGAQPYPGNYGAYGGGYYGRGWGR
jgi:hypothetical protein